MSVKEFLIIFYLEMGWVCFFFFKYIVKKSQTGNLTDNGSSAANT